MANITLSVPDADVPELLSCAGERLGLVDENGQPRPCTNSEFKQLWLIGKTKLMRREVLQARAQRAIAAIPDTNIT